MILVDPNFLEPAGIPRTKLEIDQTTLPFHDRRHPASVKAQDTILFR